MHALKLNGSFRPETKQLGAVIVKCCRDFVGMPLNGVLLALDFSL
jgi:hypothetical protein